jgi:hypothetical protein
MCLLPTVLISLPLVLFYPIHIVTVIWHPTLSVSVAVYVAKVLLKVPTPKTHQYHHY